MSKERADVLELLFEYTHRHMGTGPTPCIYRHQFDEIVEKIEEIYRPEPGMMYVGEIKELTEEEKGEILRQWNERSELIVTYPRTPPKKVEP